MIKFEKFTLDNGLRVIVHIDKSTPMAALNIIYDVGARDEHADRTGFAHLFEHLMFGGSIHIPSYDEALQIAGGENNAYTTNDLTSYHLQIPAENLETAFWLESDRMLSLAFDEKSLDVQRKVVVEEFKEHYIDQPYGDVQQKMRELAYKVHPYKWMTIGKELSHIENAQLHEVKDFFFKHYTPVNAILTVAGNVSLEEIERLSRKWFGSIPSGKKYERSIPQEPKQTVPAVLEVKATVPLDALYKCWHVTPRLDERFYTMDLITEILGGGASSRLFQSLVKEQRIFSSIECSHFDSIDAGLLFIDGKLIKGKTMAQAEKAINRELDKIKNRLVEHTELDKAKNITESVMAFEDVSLAGRANSLGTYELLGDANLMNKELQRYLAITEKDIQRECNDIFADNNCSTIYYISNN
jgi:zinc protease